MVLYVTLDDYSKWMDPGNEMVYIKLKKQIST